MEDHHVDRPGVEAQQCVELTGTNSSIGLIVLINQCSSLSSLSGLTPLLASCNWRGMGSCERVKDQKNHLFRRPGGSGEEPKPDPIPNSAVKLLSADGTAS